MLLHSAAVHTLIRGRQFKGYKRVGCSSAEVECHQGADGGADHGGIETTKVRFLLQKKCLFGEHFRVTGKHPVLGSWDPDEAVELEWSHGDIWTTQLEVPQGGEYEYKFLFKGKHGGIHWQPGENRVFSTDNLSSLVVEDSWESKASKAGVEEKVVNDETEQEEKLENSQTTSELELVAVTVEEQDFQVANNEAAEQDTSSSSTSAKDEQQLVLSTEQREEKIGEFLEFMRKAEGLLNELQDSLHQKARLIEEIRSVLEEK